jgi:hypothetical protein
VRVVAANVMKPTRPSNLTMRYASKRERACDQVALLVKSIHWAEPTSDSLCSPPTQLESFS